MSQHTVMPSNCHSSVTVPGFPPAKPRDQSNEKYFYFSVGNVNPKFTFLKSYDKLIFIKGLVSQ